MKPGQGSEASTYGLPMSIYTDDDVLGGSERLWSKPLMKPHMTTRYYLGSQRNLHLTKVRPKLFGRAMMDMGA
jgi:hypothetical protein